MKALVPGNPVAALAEAAVLAAVVIVPLFFNPVTERVFEPDKLAWVLALAGLGAVAMLDRGLSKGLPRSVAVPPALPLAAALVVAAGLLGTVFSVVPVVSLWGSYRRGQGALTLVAYGLLFLAAKRSLTDGDRRRRLVRALAVGLLPAVAYSLLQWFGVDSVVWDQTGPSPTDRAFGPLGNPIFLGAYLVLALPVVAQAAIVRMPGIRLRAGDVPGAGGGRGPPGARRRRRRGRPGPGPRGGAAPGLPLAAAGYGGLFAVGLAALGAAVSRGPVLGAGAALASAMVIALAATRRRNSARIIVAAAAVAGFLFLAAVGARAVAAGARTAAEAPPTAEGASRGAPAFPRGGGLVPAAEAAADRVWGSRTARERLLLWSLVGDVAAANPARALVGFGPDALAYVITPRLTRDLARLTPDRMYDRTHNTFLEAWVTAGALGTVALATLYAVAFGVGLAFLGLGRSPRSVTVSAIAGALAGAVAGYAAWPALAPLGGAGGLIAGALLGATQQPPPPAQGTVASRGDRWLVAAIVVALIGHLVEASFGLPTATGELLFWVYLGVLWAVTSAPAGATDGGVTSRRPDGMEPAPGVPGAAAAEGLIDGLALATVAFAPLLLPSPARTAAVPLLWILVPAVWIGGDVLADAMSESPWPRPLARLGVLLVLLGLFAFHPVAGAIGPVLAYAGTLVLAVGALAAALAAGGPYDRPREAWRTIVVASAGALVAIGVWYAGLRPIMADAHVRAGLRAAVHGSIEDTLGHFAAATRLWPAQPEYATYVAAALRDLALNPSPLSAPGAANFGRAIDVMEDSLSVAPSADRMAKLATLHRDAGDAGLTGEADDWLRLKEWNAAITWYEAALERWPMAPAILADYGATLERLGTIDGAAAMYAGALDLDPGNVAARAGLIRMDLAAGDVDAARAATAWGVEDDPTSLGEALDAAADIPVDQATVAEGRALFLALTGQGERARAVLVAAGADITADPVPRRILDLAAEATGAAP